MKWAHPVQQTVTEYLEFTGTTQPVESVEIRARVRGFLKERLFTEGALVKKGDLLLVIDEEPFQIQLESAKSRLAVAQANLKRAKDSKSREVARAQLNLSQSQLDLAVQEEERLQSLFRRNVATQSDIDTAQATRKTREAEAQSAKANLEQALTAYETEIVALEAEATSAEISIRNAELDLSYCRMYSPIDGRISQTRFDPGNLVGDGQSTVLATVVKMSPIYAYVSVSEKDFIRSRDIMNYQMSHPDSTDNPVEMGLATKKEFPYKGRVDYIDPGLDPGTGTMRVRAVFENADQSILPGMFVRLRLPIQEIPNSLLVPEQALGTDQSGRYLLIIGEEDKVKIRRVEVGVNINGMRAVSGDLKPDERVIVEGLFRARPDSPVTPLPLEEPKPTQAAVSSVSGRL